MLKITCEGGSRNLCHVFPCGESEMKSLSVDTLLGSGINFAVFGFTVPVPVLIISKMVEYLKKNIRNRES
jgi:hypothetical protein